VVVKEGGTELFVSTSFGFSIILVSADATIIKSFNMDKVRRQGWRGGEERSFRTTISMGMEALGISIKCHIYGTDDRP